MTHLRAIKKRNESQILVIVLIVMSIVGIIVFALTGRVLRTMKESTERKLANTSYSEAMGALDRTYNKFKTNTFADCPLSSGVYTCTIPSSQSGCGNSTVKVAYQNTIQPTYVERDDVLEINVDGYTGTDITITATGVTGSTKIVSKTIGTTSGVYGTLKEDLISSWVSGTPKTYSVHLAGSDSKIVRIRPLYTSATITVTGAGGYSLPAQQRSYTTTTTCGVGTASAVTSKLVRVEWLYPGVPAPFDFVLYNGTGTLKKY